MDVASGRRFLLGAALVGIVLRLAFGLGYWTGQPMTRDELEYLSLARSLSAGDGFVYDEVLQSASFVPFGRAPGYPAFLALVGGGATITAHVPTSVKVAQAIAGGLGVILAGLIGARLGGPRAGRAAGAIAAVYPPLVWISGYALSEGVFWPVGLLTAWLFDRAATGSQAPARMGLFAGLVSGIGILIRPALVLFLPLGVLYLAWRRRWLPLVALGLGALAVVGPWTWRNVLVHDRVMIVAADGGVTFWTGNHPLASGEGDMAANPAIKLDHERLRGRYPGLSEEAMEPIYYREALAWMADHPWQWLGLEVRKLFYLVVPVGPSYTLHSTRYYAATLVSYVPLLLLAVAGGVIGRKHLGRTPGLWLLAGSSVAVCLIFFPQERFRIPVIDPALTVLAAVALAHWWPRPAMPAQRT